jgi:two-component system sensor histidine kinase and response regulator WspE
MLDLFRQDADSQLQSLTAGLLSLERNPVAVDALEACMRAAHSLKGAARIVGMNSAVGVAHAMEDYFTTAQRGEIRLDREMIDALLRGTDLLQRIVSSAQTNAQSVSDEHPETHAFLSQLADMLLKVGERKGSVGDPPQPESIRAPAISEPEQLGNVSSVASNAAALRVTATDLNRLLALAGEARVESRWLEPYAASLLRLKRLHHGASEALDQLRELLAGSMSEAVRIRLAGIQDTVLSCHQLLGDGLVELERFGGRSINLAHRLYDAALSCRMRPFSDGVQRFPRMVRDLARSLDKEIRLEIIGAATQVDRDILDKLEAPLGHLLRNAIDHGIEAPEDRRVAGKSAEGQVSIEARHSAGALQIIVRDDGRGVDLERLRDRVVERKLTTSDTAADLSGTELLEFLLLPGFSLRDRVTDISGRGVGLDVVHAMVKQVHGAVRISTQPGAGMQIHLQLPLTLSVVRALLFESGGEPYALPLAIVEHSLKLPRQRIVMLEGREHFEFGGRTIGLFSAHEVLAGGEPRLSSEELSVIVIGQGGHTRGLVVERFLGERELFVQVLDPRLGKLKDVAAAAVMEDGTPVLILDVEDLLRSLDRAITSYRVSKLNAPTAVAHERKRVLIADDSLTVRELQRKLLEASGYQVDMAVDGMDAWNAIRGAKFDLLITDVDMPRLDGIELVKLVKNDPQLASLPVMIVSYKDHEDDRRRGLEAGADYYLTKGSFHDDTLVQAVADLIGEVAA